MKATVLIADDEPLARRTLREHLRNLGFAGPIHEARDGKAAIALANNQRPDLLFLDVVMPGATGLEVLAQLDYEPKVIFTTAYDQHALHAFESNAIDYLLKPIEPEHLERALKKLGRIRLKLWGTPRKLGTIGAISAQYSQSSAAN